MVSAETDTIIKLKGVHKSYTPGDDVLKGLSFEIHRTEFISILGASGSGKTTLLRSMNRLEEISSGVLELFGKDIESWDLLELRRKIGYAVQAICLFPHLNVLGNIAYTLSISGASSSYIKERTEELIDLIQLKRAILTRFPDELSGGEAQRVGLARALANKPDLLLLDESLGAVDTLTRRGLQDELVSIHRKVNTCFILVTHSTKEALRVGEKVMLINKGVIEQFDTPENLTKNPANDFVKLFLDLP